MHLNEIFLWSIFYFIHLLNVWFYWERAVSRVSKLQSNQLQLITRCVCLQFIFINKRAGLLLLMIKFIIFSLLKIVIVQSKIKQVCEVHFVRALIVFLQTWKMPWCPNINARRRNETHLYLMEPTHIYQNSDGTYRMSSYQTFTWHMHLGWDIPAKQTFCNKHLLCKDATLTIDSDMSRDSFIDFYLI